MVIVPIVGEPSEEVNNGMQEKVGYGKPPMVVTSSQKTRPSDTNTYGANLVPTVGNSRRPKATLVRHYPLILVGLVLPWVASG